MSSAREESCFRSLLEKYQTTKCELREAEYTIRRITGRDPDEISNSVSGSGKFRGYKERDGSSFAVRPSSYFGRRKRPYYNSSRESRRTRERDRSEERRYSESSNDDDTEKPSLQSTVFAKSVVIKSRKSTIEELNANLHVKERNRRMFNTIIGTLAKFQHEEKKRQNKETLRAEIDRKVDAATEEEHNRLTREKEELFHTRREKQIQLRCLEKKIERASSHEVYDANHRYMENFIKTKEKPHIFFLPALHTEATRKSLEESRIKIKELVRKRKEDLDNDLTEIEEWYRKESLPSDKENKCPKEEGESQDAQETESESLVVEQEDTGPDEEDSNNDKNRV